MPAGVGRVEWGARQAVAKLTGEMQDDSGWNPLKLSCALGLPSTYEGEKAAAWALSLLFLGGQTWMSPSTCPCRERRKEQDHAMWCPEG